jgi:hypothetical protein
LGRVVCLGPGRAAAELRQYFGTYGKVVSAQVMYNRETCKSRGFGFVIFEEEGALDRVLHSRIHMIDGKAVRGTPPPSTTSTTSPVPKPVSMLVPMPTPCAQNHCAGCQLPANRVQRCCGRWDAGLR